MEGLRFLGSAAALGAAGEAGKALRADDPALLGAVQAADIAEVVDDDTLAENSAIKVPSERAVKGYVDKSGSRNGLFTCDLLSNPYVSSSVAVVENQLTLLRYTVPKTGTLRHLNVFIGNKSGKCIVAIYDTGGLNAGKYTRIGFAEVEPATKEGWNKIYDPALAVTKGQQVMLGVIHNNAAVTMGRGGAGAVTSGSGVLPAGFVPAEGASPKLIGTRAVGAFEAPATVEEALLVGSGAAVPYQIIGQIL